MLFLHTTELAVWWVTATPLSIPATKALGLWRAEQLRELAGEPTPPGETPPMPWRPRLASGILRPSTDPLHERIRRRVIRTVPPFILAAALLWVVAINVASVITLSRAALVALQAGYFALAGAYGFLKLRAPNGQVTRGSKSAALVGLFFVLVSLIPVGD